MIITRYATHKLLGINESVFSQMWKRHQAGKDFYGFFTDDGKVDISDPSFIQKYTDKIIPEELEEIKNKLNKKNNKTSKPKTIKTNKKKPAVSENKNEVKVVKKRGRPPKDKTEKKTPEKKTVEVKKNDKPKEPDNKTDSKNPDENDGEKSEIKELSKKATIAKFKKDIFAAEKAEIDLKKARAELAELETIGRVCIGYLIALNQSLLDQPRSFIDELSSGIKAGKSKTDLTDIARKPAMNAISESIELIKKEIAKYKRDIKSDNK